MKAFVSVYSFIFYHLSLSFPCFHVIYPPSLSFFLIYSSSFSFILFPRSFLFFFFHSLLISLLSLSFVSLYSFLFFLFYYPSLFIPLLSLSFFFLVHSYSFSFILLLYSFLFFLFSFRYSFFFFLFPSLYSFLVAPLVRSPHPYLIPLSLLQSFLTNLFLLFSGFLLAFSFSRVYQFVCLFIYSSID